MESKITQALGWFQQGKDSEGKEIVCSSRDIFQGRLDSMLRQLIQQTSKEVEISLFTAIIGELGNNCFDHNLGQWRDIPGCWFAYGFESNYLWSVVADRGQGVRSSLGHILPDIKSDEEALEIAFHKKLSGRSSEKRGNGLKFVRGLINGDRARGLLFTSGNAVKIFGGLENKIKTIFQTKKTNGVGAFIFVLFQLET
ncbi:MAG: hypothetical protein HYU97_09175 [Deltaproteobacteria bacterium]|nr:hypothetical protein [Deltaproteobacteria bacterium]